MSDAEKWHAEDYVMAVMGCFGALLLLGLCAAFFESATADNKTGPQFTVDNVIKEVTFKAAHEYDDCGAKRGCRSVFVADTWFIQFCSVKKPGDCATRKITHAPWSWQQVGVKVTITWQPRKSWNQIVLIERSENGERVDL